MWFFCNKKPAEAGLGLECTNKSMQSQTGKSVISFLHGTQGCYEIQPHHGRE